MLNKQIIDNLSSSVRGRIVQPEDADYDEVRAIYNAMIEKRPRLIIQCANVADVITAVNFGRENDLETAIRGGGHNGPGLALVDDGLVIDLSPMKGIRVDPDAKTVRVEPGCVWGDVDHATQAFDLATVSGVIASTGVPGLTLGGGHGHLTRKHGLTVDNLLAADVVLADGQLVHTSEDENPDLLWALRGGGGNFGIVTSFLFRLHAVGNVIAGPMFWPLEELETTLEWYRDWLPNAPDDIYAYYLEAQVPPADVFPQDIHGQKVCGLMWCCTGSQEQANTALEKARGVAQPLFEHVGPVPYAMLQSLFDDLYPPGLQWYWKGDFVDEITDDAISEHLRFGEVPTPHSLMHLYPVNGAAARVRTSETAWAHRDANWSMVIAGVDPNPANKNTISKWARDYWHALHPHSKGAAYVNFMMEEGNDRIEATYGPNLERLRRVKAKYDPHNFFHINQNITPLT